MLKGGGSRLASANYATRRSWRYGRAPSTEEIKLVGESYTNRQVAELLVTAEKAVDRHRTSGLESSDGDRVELTRYAIRNGLGGTLRLKGEGIEWRRRLRAAARIVHLPPRAASRR
jgi:hypothetical protein